MLRTFLPENTVEFPFGRIIMEILDELKTGYAHEIYFPSDFNRTREYVNCNILCCLEMRDMFHSFHVKYVLNEKSGKMDRLVIYAKPCMIIEEGEDGDV